MQILKNKIRDNIMSSAIKEFKEHGFQKSTIRNIAKKAKISEGNIYRYFENKEKLLEEIVRPAYCEIFALISKYQSLRNERDSFTFADFQKHITNSISNLCKIHGNELIILSECCNGTKYEIVKQKIIDITKLFLLDILSCNKEEISKKHDFISYLIAKGFIEGLMSIYKEFKDTTEFEGALNEFNEFYFNGFLERFN
ncbi:TetR/AcrR family transcriptional regulator [Clostridiaceae bacterium M8S5]|nr:TetR/AcrR family transcriptional regulator [Clostridiaceae bacterium M8S5]